MSRNTVTLFSNGMGHFNRTYKIDNRQVISIPFERGNIGDVAASLQVFGSVRLPAPPSFTPSNSNSTSLEISSKNALWSLLSSLSGASVTLSRNGKDQSCKLLGVEKVPESDAGPNQNVVKRLYVVVMDELNSITRYRFDSIGGVRFNDPAVQLEIEKALKKNFESIKPDSTFLEVTLEPTKGATEAAIQYTVPVAAWKMRYAIRQEATKFTLEGAAVIDNNTDEDWTDFLVSVVTGNPISFRTDIADVVVPTRKMVRIIDGTVLGNVEVEDGYSVGLESVGGSRGAVSQQLMRKSLGPKMSHSNAANFGMTACAAPAAMDENYLIPTAEAPGVDTKEVGDFCIFTSKEPITILARRSAVVPMFSVPLASAGVVLHYKQSNNASRPYRAVKFKNETENTLGRGKTVLYQDGVFSGECVLETTKPGENRTLPHCLENGVKINRETTKWDTRRQSIKFSEGVALDEQVKTGETVYVIQNKKDEDFKVVLEHDFGLGRDSLITFDGVKPEETEKTETGYRVYFLLKAKEKTILTVTETLVSTSSVTLGRNFHWVNQNFILTDGPLSKDTQILAAAKIQSEIDELNVKVTQLRDSINGLTEQKERVHEDLAAAKGVAGNDTVNEWIADLKTCETEIKDVQKKKIPALEKKLREKSDELREALSKISVTWLANKTATAKK